MKKTFTRASLLLMVLFCSLFNQVMAQGVTISGTVLDGGTNETLAGANVVIKGKIAGTITDLDGKFSLKVSGELPVTLVVSFIGFQTQEIEITDANTTDISIVLEESSFLGQEVVVSASRVEESILQSPVTVEKMDILAIRDAASTDFYDALKNLKGVDFSTQSLTFKSINARGFGANGNTRFVQLIDGIDNQAPGLNFPVGNVVGINDLDLESAELLPGAASALYGPNAIQGILLLNSKSPFDYQGLSAYSKLGLNHVDEEDDDLSFYQDYGIRYAKSFNDKFAFKVTGSYLRANDFRGVDTRDQSDLVERGATERGNNRNYDGVNVYGDFPFNLGQAPALNPALIPVSTLLPTGESGNFTSTGYDEASFVDNTTESIKLGGAAHYRLNDDLEVLGQFNWGSGSTVYTANDRFVLDGFVIWTAKAELRGSNFYLRAYTTQERSGDSFAANTVASLVNQQFYLPNYIGAFVQARQEGSDAEQAHAFARGAADALQPQPGSAVFDNAVDSLRQISIAEGGAQFLDRTSLFHYEGSYNLSEQIDFADVVVGGNLRRYALESDGTLFALDNDGEEINIDEWGAYLQVGKSLLSDNLKLQGSIRYDKNEFFDGQFSPRFSSVYTINNNHNIRASFQRGFRIPTTQDQFIDLDVVTRRLIGSNQLLIDRYNFEENSVYMTNNVNNARAILAETGDIDQAVQAIGDPIVFEDFETEKVNTFEVGYKGLLFDSKLLIDAYYYFSSYQDFIAEIDFTQAVPNGLTEPGPADPSSDQAKANIIRGVDENGNGLPLQRYGFDVNADGNVESQGWALSLEYSLPKGYRLGGNVSFNELIDQQDLIDQGFRASYNTPRYRYNLSFQNREVVENLGFNVAWRWQQAFLWESAFGDGVIPEYGTLDAQVSYKIPNLKSILKLGGSNILNERFTTSFGNPRIGAIYYLSITFDEFLN
ncbi:MAG: TonB-dependent receptor [Bacteroidota bacterium]